MKQGLEGTYKKLEITGWIDNEGEEYSNVPIFCPKCNTKLRKTDALSLCNQLFIYCPNLKCRWCEIYVL